jgi:hypothetical protein
MKPNPEDTIRAYATFRVTGDALVPELITDALCTFPTTSYRKGEKYVPGKHSGPVLGRTGVWFLSTDKIVAGKNLMDHIAFLFGMLAPEMPISPAIVLPQIGPVVFSRLPDARVKELSRLLKERELTSVATLFWHGKPGARAPSVPKPFVSMLRVIPVAIETDFDTDEKPAKRVA